MLQPKTVPVGLAQAAVRESTHRVERAIVNSGGAEPLSETRFSGRTHWSLVSGTSFIALLRESENSIMD
jgi:hypothetical protein